MGNCFSGSPRQPTLSSGIHNERNERSSQKFSTDRSSAEPLKETNCSEALTPRRQESRNLQGLQS